MWILAFHDFEYFSFFFTFLNFLFLLFLLFNYSCPIFSPLYSLPICTPLPPAFPRLNSCPWVIHISSLASPSPILFLICPCLFCTYHLYFSFPVPFPPFSYLPCPSGNPPCDLYFCESVPLLVVCLVCFCFLGSVVDSCEFVVILLFIFLIFFFSLDKSR